MTFAGVRALISAITVATLTLIYLIYAYATGLFTSVSIQAVAVTMLIAGGISIVTAILVQIVFFIVFSIRTTIHDAIEQQACRSTNSAGTVNFRDESSRNIARILSSSTSEDEMTRLVAQKVKQVALLVVGFGFIAALVIFALGGSPAVALQIQFLSFPIGAIAAEILAVKYSRNGIGHA